MKTVGYKVIISVISFSVFFSLVSQKAKPVNNLSFLENQATSILAGNHQKALPPLLAQTAEKPNRIALVIGNANYSQGKLLNPVNDANDIATALREVGFEVILVTDADLRKMEEAVEQLGSKLKRGGVGLFYYAGHGVQVNGENYLIPLQSRINRAQDVRYEALPVGKLLGAMEDAENDMNIVVLDACRDNPYARQWRSNQTGLASVQSATGTLIAYATKPGGLTEDGQRRNGTYTSHLLKHIRTPGLEVELLFKKVREGVLQETNGQQIPWESSSLIGSFAFNSTLTEPTLARKNPTKSPNSSNRPRPLPSFSASPPNSSSQPILISKTTGVDYTKLRNLLVAGKWKEADRETPRAMLQAAKREKEGWFRTEDINKFACEDLRLIDQFWRESSQGKFGFRVQKEIWIKNGSPTEDWEKYKKNWRQFYIDVGWKTEESGVESGEGYVSYENLGAFKDSNLSRRGNLPARNPPGRMNENLPWGYVLIFSRAANCNL